MKYFPFAHYITLLLSIFIVSQVHAKPEKESYPIIGTVSTSLSFNHSNFVSEEQNPNGTEYGIPAASGFGWVNSTVSTGLSYQMSTAKGYSPIFLSGGISFSRALKESFNRIGLGTVQPKQFNVSDASLNLGWGVPGFNKIAKKLNANLGLSVTAPFSRASRSTGVLTSMSPSFTLSYVTPIKVIMQATGFFGYNVLENPTIQVDCRVSPDFCRISGDDLGIPNQLMNYGGVFSAQRLIYGGFRFAVSYQAFAGVGAVKFPKRDQYTSPYAQDEEQYGGLLHSASFAIIFGFNRAGSAAQQALNESLEGNKKKKKKEAEESFLTRLNFVLSMRTTQRFYSADNTRVTIPIFDFETDNYSRTSYAFVVRIAL